jgi:hypothetical protein
MKIVVKEIKANRGNCICSFWPLEHRKFGDELSVDSFSLPPLSAANHGHALPVAMVGFAIELALMR